MAPSLSTEPNLNTHPTSLLTGERGVSDNGGSVIIATGHRCQRL